MQEKINALKTAIDAEIERAETGRGLYEIKLKFQAGLKEIMSGMKDIAKEDRPAFGRGRWRSFEEGKSYQ